MPSGYTPLFCALVVRVSATQHAVARIAEASSRALSLLVIGRRPLRLKVGEPAQRAQSGHKAVSATARDHEVRDALKAPSHWLTRQREIDVAGANNWIFVRSGANKDSVIDPL